VSLGEAFGEPSDVEVVDFAEQIRATNERARSETKAEAAEQPAPGVRGIPLARAEHSAALVAVVSGAGVATLFEELGAITVDGAIRGTASEDALRIAIESAPTRDVVVLPNNEDVYSRVLAMKDSLSKHTVVLRSGDIAHGLAAAVAYGDARDTDAAIRDMEAALAHVKTGVVMIATTFIETAEGSAGPGHAVGIAEGSVVKVGEDAVEVAVAVAVSLVADVRELLTVLSGASVAPEERERLRAALQTELPNTTIELHDGGQPLHRYVMAAE
jgi:dihydroxyacetone kinase-like predicted kinase